MNFRKHICITLAFLLLVSNIGFAFNVHYCGDEISSISLKTTLSSEEIEKNCCGEIEEKSDCCDTKVLHFQKKSETVRANLITRYIFYVSFSVFLLISRFLAIYKERERAISKSMKAVCKLQIFVTKYILCF